MRRIGTTVRLAALLLIAGVVACSDDDGGGNVGPSGEGQLTLIIKDAAGDVQAAVITIDEISLSGADGRRVIMNSPYTVDLFPLSTGDSTVINNSPVPAGDYTRMQLKLSGSYVQVDNGDGTSSYFASATDYPGLPTGVTPTGTLVLNEPADANGYDVPLPGGGIRITDGQSDTLVIDFNVGTSFAVNPSDATQWTLNPSVTAADVGTLGGATVTLAADSTTQARFDSAGVSLGMFNGTFTGGDSVARTVAFTGPDTAGAFLASLRYLPAGTYNFNVTGPGSISAFTTDVALPGTLTVTGGGTAATTFTINSATFVP